MLGIVSTLLWCGTFLTQPFLMILHFFGIGYFIIRNDEEKLRKLFKSLGKSTISSATAFQNGKLSPSGTFIGKNCFGYYMIGERNDGIYGQIHLFTSRAIFNEMIQSEEIVVNSTTNLITHATSRQRRINFLNREGTYSNIYYSQRRLDVTTINPCGAQKKIVSDIIAVFREKGYATIFLHGISGAGKSTVGILVAKELDGSFCHTFNPTNPGDSLHRIAREAEIADEEGKPLVVVIEEANTLIREINKNAIILHKDVQTLVYNKSTYNTFLDDMILFKNVILILTSNESADEISAIDPCYLRKGRINATYSMMEPLEPLISKEEASSPSVNS